ncbi:MAG: hypothetical protein NTV70_22785, partial [Acidobacteria bacterium]|nr:hypothetical protein [Acidobacteriota bacterium]
MGIDGSGVTNLDIHLTATPVPGRSGSQLWGWESIAEYLECDPKTARKLAQQGLPVCRESDLPRARVFAHSEELDRWMANRVVAAPAKPHELVQTINHTDRIPFTPPPERNAGNESPRPDLPLLPFGLACLVLLLAWAAYSAWPQVGRLAGSQALAKPGRILSRGTSEGEHLVKVAVPAGTDRLAATPDGRHFFTATLRQPTVYRYDYPTWAKTAIETQVPVTVIAAGADPDLIFCGTPWGIRSVRVRSGRQRDYQLGGMVHTLVVAPDGETLYAAMGRLGVLKVSIGSGEITSVVTQPAPEYMSLDPSGEHLYISYQNGGPGGWDGHDTIEVRNLKTGAALNSPPGPPL